MIRISADTQLWLMKSEPDVYSWDDLVAEGEGTWDGVRNHLAARNLRTMKEGDLAFFYHSNIGKEIVGVADGVVGHALCAVGKFTHRGSPMLFGRARR